MRAEVAHDLRRTPEQPKIEGHNAILGQTPRRRSRWSLAQGWPNPGPSGLKKFVTHAIRQRQPFACRKLSPRESDGRCYKTFARHESRVDPFRRSLYVPVARWVSQSAGPASNSSPQALFDFKDGSFHPMPRLVRVIKVREVNGKDARGPQTGETSSGWFSQGREASPFVLSPTDRPGSNGLLRPPGIRCFRAFFLCDATSFSPNASGVGADAGESLIARTPLALRLNVSRQFACGMTSLH